MNIRSFFVNTFKSKAPRFYHHVVALGNITPSENSKKRAKPRLYLIYLCIVMRCIMNIKKIFVNTLLLLAYSEISSKTITALDYHLAIAID